MVRGRSCEPLMYSEWIGWGCFPLYFVLSCLYWIAHLLCRRRSIDWTTLNLCVFWYISRCLLTRGLSRFALLASAFTPAYFPVLTRGIRARFNDGVRFSGSIIDDWTRFERCAHLDGVVLAVTFLTVMKILLEKLFQRDSLCWDTNFAKDIMERRSKLLKIK